MWTEGEGWKEQVEGQIDDDGGGRKGHWSSGEGTGRKQDLRDRRAPQQVGGGRGEGFGTRVPRAVRHPGRFYMGTLTSLCLFNIESSFSARWRLVMSCLFCSDS